jgi:hypothetical protein
MYHCRMFRFISCIVFIAFHQQIYAAALSIEGTYQGKNLYIQNPLSGDGVGLCATKVTVNGDILPGSISRETFEIDFSLYKLQIGDPVFIVIDHNEGCKPVFVNPEVLLPKSSFEVISFEASNEGFISWSTQNENGKLNFLIEQFRWNKWVVVGEVQGKGTSGTNNYQFQLKPHSGENMVRVAQRDHSGEKRVSKEVRFQSNVPAVTKNPTKVKDKIYFTAKGKPAETRYEIFDAYGNIVKKGIGSSVDCSNLLKGAYYINFDNVNQKFIKI